MQGQKKTFSLTTNQDPNASEAYSPCKTEMLGEEELSPERSRRRVSKGSVDQYYASC